jgi:hypothetical protein
MKVLVQWAETYLGKERLMKMVTDYLDEQKKASDGSTEEVKK